MTKGRECVKLLSRESTGCHQLTGRRGSDWDDLSWEGTRVNEDEVGPEQAEWLAATVGVWLVLLRTVGCH